MLSETKRFRPHGINKLGDLNWAYLYRSMVRNALDSVVPLQEGNLIVVNTKNHPDRVSVEGSLKSHMTQL